VKLTARKRFGTSKVHRSLTYRVSEAETLAAKHKGLLPNVLWLQQHRPALATSMQRHPEAFTHLKQDRKSKTIADHVRAAENLARQHQRILPSVGWMQQHHPSLASCMHAHPEAFKHLIQDRSNPRPDELIEVAVSLASQNHGVLPSNAWCDANGHSGIRSTIRNHRKLFLKRFKKIGRARHTKFVLKPVDGAVDTTGERCLRKTG
jgi:hypothetical protein